MIVIVDKKDKYNYINLSVILKRDDISFNGMYYVDNLVYLKRFKNRFKELDNILIIDKNIKIDDDYYVVVNDCKKGGEVKLLLKVIKNNIFKKIFNKELRRIL